MQLSPGDKLGPYEIAALIGKGGMGEVYRGTDTRLGRAVAIKVSAREFNDRFEREARAISSLNHPNICTLYDVGPNYLVMEFVEGETLSKLLERGPLPLDQALRHAIQIADALAAAHAKGVTHRDLKPGNIIITKHGVKVLDFGLAKLSLEKVKSGADVDTLTEPITRAGAILGTLSYMSPEQVEAKETDARSDIFSFGVVLYEMVTGHRAFTGDTQASVLAAVLRDQPTPITHRLPQAPKSIERVVRKCLEKNPDDRWQSARDLKPALELIDLDAPAVQSSSSGSGVHAQVPPASRGAKWIWPAAAVLVLAVAGLGWTFWPKAEPPARVTRFEVALPPEAQVQANNFYVRVSPDGTKLAFTVSGPKAGIWIRDLETVQARQLPGTENAVAPFWSPDSRSLAFGDGDRLMRVEIAGGPPRALAESQFPVGSGAWTTKNEIVFGHRGGGALMKVAAAGGVPAPVTALAPGDVFHSLPSLLPDGRTFLYLRQNPQTRGMFAASLDSKPGEESKEQVMAAQLGATFVPGNSSGGHLFFVRDGTLMAQPFDASAMRLSGEPVPVVEQIGTGPLHAHFSVTSAGVMAYRTGPGSKLQLMWLDRDGKGEERVGQPGNPISISFSPDEQRVAVLRSDTLTPLAGDIWLLDVGRGVETRLTTGQMVRVAPTTGPVWSSDGKQLAYSSGNKVYIKDSGGAAEARPVRELVAVVTDWTRDGKYLIVSAGPNLGRSDVVAIPADGTAEPTPLIATDASEALGRLSPDNRWIAYISNQSGRNEVYVRPFNAPGSGDTRTGPVIQISRDGGMVPQWRADGKELYFLANATTVMSAQIEISSDTFRPAAPVRLGLQTTQGVVAIGRNGRFLVPQPLDRGAQTPITVVTNWEASLKR